jgi:pyruvate formate lyase activating enzyme
MREAKYWESKKDYIQCTLCPHNCKIIEDKTGLCKVRKNVDGKLMSLVYGKAVAVNVDPIEKKPLYHFMPGTKSLSIGTVGCNLFCSHCQNWDIARGTPESIPAIDLTPKQVIEMAKEKGVETISYTYNEPTVFFEYALECAKLAKKEGIKNIIVTNGFINKEPAEEFIKYMDAANVDLKAFNDDFYKKICGGKLSVVLDTLKLFHKNKDKIWIEITNLIIDGKNDLTKEVDKMCKWIKENLSSDVPIHFSRSFPMYKMQDISPTPENTLIRVRNIAMKYLNYVYIGNTELESNTVCPKCKKILIHRRQYSLENNLVEGNKCACGEVIFGVFS